MFQPRPQRGCGGPCGPGREGRASLTSPLLETALYGPCAIDLSGRLDQSNGSWVYTSVMFTITIALMDADPRKYAIPRSNFLVAAGVGLFFFSGGAVCLWVTTWEIAEKPDFPYGLVLTMGILFAGVGALLLGWGVTKFAMGARPMKLPPEAEGCVFYHRNDGKQEAVGKVVGSFFFILLMAGMFNSIVKGLMFIVVNVFFSVILISVLIYGWTAWRARKRWKFWLYRIKDGVLTIRTPIPALGKGGDFDLSRIRAVIEETVRSRRSTSTIHHKLESADGDVYRIPEGGEVYMDGLVRAIRDVNPSIEFKRERA